MSDSLQTHRLYPTRLLCPRNSPDKKTGVGCHSLLQGIFPTQGLSTEFSRQDWSGLPFPSPGDLPNPGIEPGSPTLQADSFPSEPPGKPILHYHITYTHNSTFHSELSELSLFQERFHKERNASSFKKKSAYVKVFPQSILSI